MELDARLDGAVQALGLVNDRPGQREPIIDGGGIGRDRHRYSSHFPYLRDRWEARIGDLEYLSRARAFLA